MEHTLSRRQQTKLIIYDSMVSIGIRDMLPFLPASGKNIIETCQKVHVFSSCRLMMLVHTSCDKLISTNNALP